MCPEPSHATPADAGIPGFQKLHTPASVGSAHSEPSTPLVWRNGEAARKTRLLPEETPIALTYNRVSFAVMMASPYDLRDFAIGFSKSEGIVEDISEIEDLEILHVESGIECRMTLGAARESVLDARRRRIAGPVGCGLCGMDSLEQAVLPAKKVTSSLRISAALIAASLVAMQRQQALNKATHAVHAAAFINASSGDLLLREDIGRHNALDKLVGAALRSGAPANDGALLLTSRVSIELIQKAAMFGAPVLVAVSVPTARAMREADAAGITLIGVARGDGFEIFTHPERILLDDPNTENAA